MPVGNSTTRAAFALAAAIAAGVLVILLLRFRAGVGESLEGPVVADAAAISAGLAVAALTIAAMGRRGRRTHHL